MRWLRDLENEQKILIIIVRLLLGIGFYYLRPVYCPQCHRPMHYHDIWMHTTECPKCHYKFVTYEAN